jgi:hypothetical protein
MRKSHIELFHNASSLASLFAAAFSISMQFVEIRGSRQEFGCDELYLSLFPPCDDITASLFLARDATAMRCATGRWLCEPAGTNFSYTMIGSHVESYRESRAEGLPRDAICIRGDVIPVTYLSSADSGKDTQRFLVVPRGVSALVRPGWRYRIGAFDRTEWILSDQASLSAVAFDSPSRVRFFGGIAFSRFVSLRSFGVPASLEVIGYRSFEACQHLSAVTIERGSRLKSIQSLVFSKCDRLQFSDLPPNIPTLSAYLFQRCGLPVLRLDSISRLSRIEFAACIDCARLHAVSIPGSVVQIDGDAFRSCVALSEVSFMLPSKLAAIGYRSFSGCSSLAQFEIVESVAAIDGAFLQSSGVRQVCVHPGNANFKTIDGFLVNQAGTSIICYFGTEGDLCINSTIEHIGQGAFQECPFVRSITFEIGSKLKRVDKQAFRDCTSLKQVHFGGRLPDLQALSFGGCARLKDVFVGPGRSRLQSYCSAFDECPLRNRPEKISDAFLELEELLYG